MFWFKQALYNYYAWVKWLHAREYFPSEWLISGYGVLGKCPEMTGTRTRGQLTGQHMMCSPRPYCQNTLTGQLLVLELVLELEIGWPFEKILYLALLPEFCNWAATSIGWMRVAIREFTSANSHTQFDLRVLRVQHIARCAQLGCQNSVTEQLQVVEGWPFEYFLRV